MMYGSLFSGIGGIDLGLDRAGMDCAFQVEKNRQAQKVLSRHWPDVLKHEDIQDFSHETIDARPDLICGGFPCQDVSVAGRRAGLAGKRSGLFFEATRIVSELTPTWILIENVPGLLSSNFGRDLQSVICELTGSRFEVPSGGWRKWGFATGPKYQIAWRVFNSQWFGVPQRRRRVFIVGHSSDIRSAASVLFEPHSLPWDPSPSRQPKSQVANTITASFANNGGKTGGKTGGKNGEPINHVVEVARCLNAGGMGRQDYESETLLPVYQCQGGNVGPIGTLTCGTNETRVVPFTVKSVNSHDRSSHAKEADVARTLDRNGAFGSGNQGGTIAADEALRVRKLTPIECERLQGFPDDWTAGLSDSARYRTLGNAVTVNVAEWIGRRIVKAHADRERIAQ